MKKNEALAVFNSRIVNKQVYPENFWDKESIECEMRKLARQDEGFEDTVLELGISTLAKTYLKSRNN